jgi:hypothetical protein
MAENYNKLINKLNRNVKMHPLHLAVADVIDEQIKANNQGELIRDPACGGKQHKQQLPLFINENKHRDTRMCCVDLLVIKSNQVEFIIEIEESGFLPTKICGKFLQSALANYFIHESLPEKQCAYAEKVLFIQVIDGSKFPEKSLKKIQEKKIQEKIQKILPLKDSRISDYRLIFVSSKPELIEVSDAVVNHLG